MNFDHPPPNGGLVVKFMNFQHNPVLGSKCHLATVILQLKVWNRAWDDVELENSDNRMKMEMSHHMSTKYEIMKDHHQIIAESCVVP